MYHATDYYWEKKSPAFNFFAAVPFGFTANELFAWVQYGGGQMGGSYEAAGCSGRCGILGHGRGL